MTQRQVEYSSLEKSQEDNKLQIKDNDPSKKPTLDINQNIPDQDDEFTPHDNLVKKHKSFWRVFYVALIVALGSLYLGYCLSVLSLASETIYKVFNVPKDQESMYYSFLQSALPFGAMIGSISSGKLLDVASRKQAFIIIDVLGILGTAISIIKNIHILILSRFIAGLCTGFNSSIIPLYLQEISPVSISGSIGTIFSISINVGIILGSLNGQFFDEHPTANGEYWMFVFLFPLFLTFFRIIFLFLFANHETPFYYLFHEQRDNCKSFLEKIYLPEYVQQAQQEVQVLVNKAKISSEGYRDMFKPQYLKRLVVGCILQFFQQFSGVNAVIMYSGTILKDMNFSFRETNTLSLISLIILFMAALFSGFFVNKLGQRLMLIYGSAFSAIFLIGLTFLSYQNDKDYQIYSIILICCFYCSFNFSLGPLVWVYCAEILPEKGISIATLVNWTSCTILIFTLPYIQPLWIAFLIFFIMCVICTIFTYFFVYETKGKSRLEIANMYNPKDQYNVITNIPDDKDL